MTTKTARAPKAPSPPSTTTVPAEVQGVYLACALRLLRCADSLLADGDPLTAEMEDVAEVVRSAAENLVTWLDSPAADDDDRAQYVYDALDACTCATALIEAHLNPRNGKTISPIKGIMSLAADRLAEIVEHCQGELRAVTNLVRRKLAAEGSQP